MKSLMRKNKRYFIGAIAGAAVGFLYWQNIGCVTGTCAITSNPIGSVLYFSFMGSLFFGLFENSAEEKLDKEK